MHNFSPESEEVNAISDNSSKGHFTKASRTGILFLSVLFSGYTVVARDDPEINGILIQAVFLYKFLSFVDWPENNTTPDQYSIGILESPEMMAALQPIGGTDVNGRVINLEALSSEVSLEEMGEFEVLFIGNDGERISREYLVALLASLEGKPVLTVSARKGFAEMGGMVEFVARRNRMRFSLNPDEARRHGLKMRASLQRLAIRIASTREVTP